MNSVDMIEMMLPVVFSFSNLETVKTRSSLLIIREATHQYLCCPGNQEISNPQHVRIHVVLFSVIEQGESQA